MKETGKKAASTINNVAIRKFLSRMEVRPWVMLVALSLIISILLFPNFLSRPKVYNIGDVAESDIKASADILIENEAQTIKDREKAVEAVPYVYDFDPLASNIILELKEALSDAWISIAMNRTDTQGTLTLDKILTEKGDDKTPVDDRLLGFSDVLPDNENFEKLMISGFPQVQEENIIQVLTAVFEKGVVGNMMVLMSQVQKGIVLQSIQTQEETLVTDLNRFYDVKGAKEFIRNQREELIEKGDTPEIADLSIEIAASLIAPNVTFNKRETELRKNIARESVKPTYYQIKKGEMLVREGERIDQNHLIKLSEEAELMGEHTMFERVPGMTILIGVLFSFVYMAGLMRFRASSDETRYNIFNAVTLLVVFIFIWAYGFIAEEVARGFHSFGSRELLFALPVACGAMLVTVFQGMNVAVAFSLLISVLGCLAIDEGVEFFIYFFTSSLAAAYWVREYRERGIMIKIGVKVGLINMVLCLSIETIYGSLFSMETIVALVAGFIGGVLAGVISSGIIPLVEMTFGFTTDIKLLELANLDQPLLRELMVRAPGTYHHSVIVSNMVEATAKAINANPLLAKVSSYYHDIGKMKKPLYFIENQVGDENRHEKLAPSMSSLILISHVKDGAELAKEHKLGREIIDIIQQHHGKCLITYFYQKAKEQEANRKGKSSQIKQEDFRYPGPKPQTKEAGLVMLADMVEAATRSLVDPTPARIQGTVQKIINKVFSDGQLDDCELTLKDLNEIAKSFSKTLGGIFHHRIEYPELNSKGVTMAVNGDTDQIPSEDTRSKRQDDRREDKEGLKRLGL